MSLARIALRVLTVLAIKDRTMAEERVKDSSIVDLEAGILNAPKPIALVYTDSSEFVPTGRDIWGGQGSTTLVILLAVAGATQLDGGEVEFAFPHTDASIELSLDVMERQIQAALMDPDSLWAQRWRGVVANITKWSSKRGGSTKEGARFGARQIIIEVETYHDPIPGRTIEGEWATLMAALTDDSTPADTKSLAGPLLALMQGQPIPNWKRNMMHFGIDRPALRGMGLAPVIFAVHGQEPDPEDEATMVDASVGGHSAADTEALVPEDEP